MTQLTFSCDTAEHRIAVSDAAGRPLFAFGGYGRQPGAFDSPVDATFVRPEFFGEPPFAAVDMLYVAVADYGNARVQILDLHGVVVATFSDEIDVIGRPCRVTWRAPFLEIEGINGSKTRLHLGAALLAHDAAREPAERTVARPSRHLPWAVC